MIVGVSEKYKEFVSNTLVFGLSAFGSKLILFLLVPLYTNTMTTEQYGIADLVTTICTFVVPLSSLSFQDALFRFAFDGKVDKRELLKCFYLTASISVIIFFAIGLALDSFNLIYGCAFYFILLGTATIIRDPYALYVKARGKTRIFAIDAVLYVVYLAAANWVLLVCFHLGAEGYLLSIVLAKLCSLVFLYAFSNEPRIVFPKNIDRRLLRRMFAYSAPLVLNSISWWVMSYANRYALGLLLGTASVGLFAVASKIPSLISTFVDIFSQSWTILAVKEFEDGKDPRVFRQIFSAFSCFVLLLGSVVTLFIKPFMSFYVAPEFVEATVAVPFLLIGAIFLAYSSFFGIIFNSAKNTSPLMTSSMAGAIINVVLVVLLLPVFGVIGASIATAAGYLVTFLVRLACSRKHIVFKLNGIRLSCSLLVITFQCTIATFNSDPVATELCCLALLILLNMNVLGILVRQLLHNARQKGHYE